MDDSDDRSRWTGPQWTQHAAMLAAGGVDDAVQVLLDAVRNRGTQRNLGARMAAAEKILQLVGALKPEQQKPAGTVTAIDFAALSEQVRLAKQDERRGRG
jgi:hypothetical protein